MMVSPHIVFILGAGASAEAGVPTMQNFLDTTDKIIQNLSYHNNLDDELNNAYKDVIETRGVLNQIYHKSNIDLDNIEHLYGALIMASTFGALGNWDVRKINKKIKNIEYLIIRTIEESMVLGSDPNVPQYPKPYEYFLDLIIEIQNSNPMMDISIITFNYDLAFEISHMLKKKDNPALRGYIYGFEGSKNDYTKIKLLKLHGSLNWADMGNNNFKNYDIVNYHKQPDILIKQAEINKNTYPVASNLHKEIGFEKLKRIAIIPPSFNKDFKYIDLRNVWREAAKQLSLAESIYICGFSLSNADNFFRYLYSIGTINNNILKNIDVFNYNKNEEKNIETKERYHNLIGQGFLNRFNYHNMKFSEMLDILSEKYLNRKTAYSKRPLATFI